MFQPNCPCCSCVVFSDDFNRSDSSSIGTDWTEKIGNWEIVSNTLRCAASIASNSWAYVAPAEISSYQQHAVECDLRSSSSGDEIGIVFRQGGTSVGSDTEKSYVKLTVGTGLMQVYRSRYNGDFFSPAMLQEPITRSFEVSAATNTWHNLRICHNFDDSLAIYLNGDLVYGDDASIAYVSTDYTVSTYNLGPIQAPSGSTAVGGPWIGSVSGTPQFDDFIIEKGERRNTTTAWDEITANTGCICEHCTAYEASATVISETCSTLGDGNWHFTPTTSTNPAPVYTASGGEWVVTPSTVGVVKSAARCFVAGTDADSVDFTFSADIGWSNDNTHKSLSISVTAAPNSGSKFAVVQWVVDENPNGAEGTRAVRTTTASSSVDNFDSAIPAQGDTLSIRVQSDGSGTFTITFAVNGAAFYTKTGATLYFDDEMNAVAAIGATGDLTTTGTIKFDNITLTHN